MIQCRVAADWLSTAESAWNCLDVIFRQEGPERRVRFSIDARGSASFFRWGGGTLTIRERERGEGVGGEG